MKGECIFPPNHTHYYKTKLNRHVFSKWLKNIIVNYDWWNTVFIVSTVTAVSGTVDLSWTDNETPVHK